MRKLNFILVLGVILSIGIYSCKKDSDNPVDNNPILGLWQLQSEQVLVLKDNDTVSSDIFSEDRKVEFRTNSVF